MEQDCRLTLWFDGGARPQLARTYFYHPLINRPLCTCRGRISFAAEGTFAWTSAVKGLCMLLMGSYLSCRQGGLLSCLSGGQGSLAASLDYAISKKPCWLQDMFGVDSDGRLVIQRLVLRRNPERKRAGPVEILLNNHFFPAARIQINLDGKEGAALGQIEAAMEAMEPDLERRGRSIVPLPRRTHSRNSRNIVLERCPPAILSA